MPFSLIQAATSAGLSVLFSSLLKSTGREAAANQEKMKMSQYEIGYDDDDFGGIGADYLIGDDVLDDLDVSGDGTMEIVGAKRRPNVRGRRVVRRKLTAERRYPLGLVPTTVAAATQVNIPSAPQNLFKVQRFVVPSDIAFSFRIADIKVGNQSQLAQASAIPAAVFSEVAIDTEVTFDTAEIGNQLSVDVFNTSAGSLVFSAAFLGIVAKR